MQVVFLYLSSIIYLVDLGDIVVSTQQGHSGSVSQYDFGKVKDDDWESVGWLARPPDILLRALANLQAEHEFRGPTQAQKHLNDAIRRHDGWGKRFGFPKGEIDRLFLASYPHQKASRGCVGCDISKVIERFKRDSTNFQIHYGVIASGNSLVKDAHFRDRIATRMDQCICLEMEAAGIMNDFPCLVIRGICDSHKNDNWQRYASATAAAFAKELLSFMSTTDFRSEEHSPRIDIEVITNPFEKFKVMEEVDDAILATTDNGATAYDTSVGIQATTDRFDESKVTDQVDGAISITPTNGVVCNTPSAELEIQATIDKLEITNQADESALASTIDGMATESEIHSTDYFDDKATNQAEDATLSISNNDASNAPGLDSEIRTVDKLEVTNQADDATLTTITDDIPASDGSGLESTQSESPEMSTTISGTESYEKKEETYSKDYVFATDMLITEVSDLVAKIPLADYKATVPEALHNSKTTDEKELVKSQEDLSKREESNKTPQADGQLQARLEDQKKMKSTSLESSEVVSDQSNSYPKVTPSEETSKAVHLEAAVDQASDSLPTIAPSPKTSKAKTSEAASVKVVAEQASDSIPTTTAGPKPSKAAGVKAASDQSEKSHPTTPETVNSPETYSGSTSATNILPVETELDSKKKALLAEITKSLGDSSDINTKMGDSDNTLLHEAAKNGTYDMAEMLLDQGADVHVKNKDDKMPLHLAARYGKVEVAKLLLDRGADLEGLQGPKGIQWTALHYSVKHGKVKMTRLLLDRGAKCETPTAKKWRPIHLAAKHGQVETTKLLLERKVKLEFATSSKYRALHLAALDGRVEIVRLLLDGKAKLEAIGGDKGCTALLFAVINNHVEVINLLLDRKAELKAADSEKWTALHYAASNGHVEVTRLLLDRKADLEATDSEDKTALHHAASEDHVEVVKLILNRKANIEAVDNQGKTALHHAVCQNHLEVVRLLVDGKAKLNTTDSKGKTALHHAISEDHVDVARLLLDGKANLEIVDAAAKTALHYAACKNSVDMVRLLVRRNANLEAMATSKWTALHYAAYKGYEEVVELLLNSGANSLAKTQYSKRPSELAKEQGHEDIVQLLKEYGAGPRLALFRF